MLSQILSTLTYNSLSNSTQLSDNVTAAFGGMFAAMMIPFVAVLVVTIIGMWKVFEKAGYAGWKSIIPFYNMYILTEISGQNGWLFLLSFIPFVGSLIWSIMVSVKMAPAFGKSTAFAIGLIFLTPIFYCILGFGNAQYTLGKASTNSAKEPKAN